jgi:hypothetical protein
MPPPLIFFKVSSVLLKPVYQSATAVFSIEKDLHVTLSVSPILPTEI